MRHDLEIAPAIFGRRVALLQVFATNRRGCAPAGHDAEAAARGPFSNLAPRQEALHHEWSDHVQFMAKLSHYLIGRARRRTRR